MLNSVLQHVAQQKDNSKTLRRGDINVDNSKTLRRGDINIDQVSESLPHNTTEQNLFPIHKHRGTRNRVNTIPFLDGLLTEINAIPSTLTEHFTVSYSETDIRTPL